MTPIEKLDAAIAAKAKAPALRVVESEDDTPPRGPAPSSAALMSELFLADTFIARAGPAWRYVKEWDTWFEWSGDGWYEDRRGKVRGYVADIIREAMGWPHVEAFTASNKRKFCSNGTASGVLALAGAHADVSVSADLWDADPMALGVPGGVVDLRTGAMRDADPGDYISKRCAVRPERGSPDRWLDHLDRVMRGDQEMIRLLKQFFGYMLTGQVGEHALLFLYGHGGNGKGVIVETLIRLMGDYGYAAPVDLLMEQKQKAHPVELAMLRGKRAVSCSEPPQGSRWDDGRIRSLTGGDTITARRMNENLSSFAPTHKLLVMGNHKPTLRSVDDAIRRRFNIVNFSLQIPAEERDPMFAEKLQAEWPQILCWMIEGCMDWQRHGLMRPETMVQATNEYLQDEDSFGQFLTDRCDRSPEKFDPVSTVFRAYTEWCEAVGERASGRKHFRSLLFETPGCERKAGAVPECVQGLAVKESARPVAQAKQSAAWDQD